MSGWVLVLIAAALAAAPTTGAAGDRLTATVAAERADGTNRGAAAPGSWPGRGHSRNEAEGRGADEPPDGARLLDLISVCLAAGLPVDRALEAVADLGNRDSPIRRELGLAAGRLRLGTPPEEVWTANRTDPVLRRLGDVLRRTTVSGAAATDSLEQAAARLRAEAAATDVARAERAGVLVAGPLGLCFLPAFVVLGIVPVVAGLAGDVLPTVVP